MSISLEFDLLEDEHALLKRDTVGPQLGGANFPGTKHDVDLGAQSYRASD